MAPGANVSAIVAECRQNRVSLPGATTFTGETLVRSGAQNVQSFLVTRVPGLSTDGSGRIFAFSRVNDRPEPTVIAVDGRRIDEASTQLLIDMTPAEVAFIDVTRSTAATAFGFDARNGAIAVYTRQGCGLLPR